MLQNQIRYFEKCKILFLKYEDTKKDSQVHANRLAEFMGVPISVAEEYNGVVKRL